MRRLVKWMLILSMLAAPANGLAWNDETHIAIARAAGYKKWFNAAGADMAKIKAGDIEKKNHFVNNPRGATVTPEMVMEQASRYNDPGDADGHLYGAIIGALRANAKAARDNKYTEFHLAFCAHYVGDLSQPLHNTPFNTFNKKAHAGNDAIINAEVLDHLSLIRIYPIRIRSERDLARHVARIANLSMALAYRLEKENRNLSRQEAYRQISHSASLLRGILNWVGKFHSNP